MAGSTGASPPGGTQFRIPGPICRSVRVGWGGPRRCWGAVPPGNLERFRGAGGKSSESRPPMRRPALELSSRCPKNGSAGDPHLPCPPRWGVGVCTGPASKKRIVRHLLRAATTCVRLRRNVQAIFCRRRHQPRRPPNRADSDALLKTYCECFANTVADTTTHAEGKYFTEHGAPSPEEKARMQSYAEKCMASATR